VISVSQVVFSDSQCPNSSDVSATIISDVSATIISDVNATSSALSVTSKMISVSLVRIPLQKVGSTCTIPDYVHLSIPALHI
jgi:hypothetical protein